MRFKTGMKVIITNPLSIQSLFYKKGDIFTLYGHRHNLITWGEIYYWHTTTGHFGIEEGEMKPYVEKVTNWRSRMELSNST